jgi:hypothetical protein
MGQDPFIAKLLQREKEEHTLGAILGNALLAGAIPFFTFEVGKLALLWVASDKDPKFDPVMSWPVAIAAGFITACILVGAATQLGARNRERLAIGLVVLALAIEICK